MHELNTNLYTEHNARPHKVGLLICLLTICSFSWLNPMSINSWTQSPAPLDFYIPTVSFPSFFWLFALSDTLKVELTHIFSNFSKTVEMTYFDGLWDGKSCTVVSCLFWSSANHVLFTFSQLHSNPQLYVFEPTLSNAHTLVIRSSKSRIAKGRHSFNHFTGNVVRDWLRAFTACNI